MVKLGQRSEGLEKAASCPYFPRLGTVEGYTSLQRVGGWIVGLTVGRAVAFGETL